MSKIELINYRYKHRNVNEIYEGLKYGNIYLYYFNVSATMHYLKNITNNFNFIDDSHILKQYHKDDNVMGDVLHINTIRTYVSFKHFIDENIQELL